MNRSSAVTRCPASSNRGTRALPTYPAPPVTKTRHVPGVMADPLLGRQIEDGVAQREVGDLHEPVGVVRNIEIDVAQTPQRVVGLETAQGHDAAVAPACGLDTADDIRRRAGTA